MDESSLKVDPVLKEWLDRVSNPTLLEILDGNLLTAISLTLQRDPHLDVPADIMNAWKREISSKRLIVSQSEVAFIDRLVQKGSSWDEIAKIADVSSGKEMERRHRELMEYVQKKIADPPIEI